MSINQALQACIDYLENMSEEESKELAEQFNAFCEKRRQEEIKNTFKYLESCNLKKEIADKAKRIINALGSNPHVEYIREHMIVLFFWGPTRDVFEVTLKRGAIDVWVRIPDDNGIRYVVKEDELPALYQKFLDNRCRAWKDYRAKPFRALQWTGDNLGDMETMLSEDPDTGCGVRIESAWGHEVRVLWVRANNYVEAWPGDYLISWGDHFKSVNRRFFNEFFEEVE